MTKHLTIKKRVQLQYMIESNSKLTLALASKELDVATTTIYRELINKRIKESMKANFGSLKGAGFDCPTTSKFPYVCNECDRISYLPESNLSMMLY